MKFFKANFYGLFFLCPRSLPALASMTSGSRAYSSIYFAIWSSNFLIKFKKLSQEACSMRELQYLIILALETFCPRFAKGLSVSLLKISVCPFKLNFCKLLLNNEVWEYFLIIMSLRRSVSVLRSPWWGEFLFSGLRN